MLAFLLLMNSAQEPTVKKVGNWVFDKSVCSIETNLSTGNKFTLKIGEKTGGIMTSNEYGYFKISRSIYSKEDIIKFTGKELRPYMVPHDYELNVSIENMFNGTMNMSYVEGSYEKGLDARSSSFTALFNADYDGDMAFFNKFEKLPDRWRLHVSFGDKVLADDELVGFSKAIARAKACAVRDEERQKKEADQ